MVTIGIVYHAMSHPCHNNNRVTTGISSLHMKKSNSSIFFNPFFFRFFFSDLTFSFLRKRRHDVIEFKEICLCTVASSFHKKKKKRKAITASSKLKRKEICYCWIHEIHPIHVPCWIDFPLHHLETQMPCTPRANEQHFRRFEINSREITPQEGKLCSNTGHELRKITFIIKFYT
jgi:hypothetical protein